MSGPDLAGRIGAAVSGPDLAGRIGHDLKSALSPIRTSAFVLRQGRQLPEATHRELLQVIDRQSQRLAGMIDEAVDWQRALAGTLVRRGGSHDVAMLLDLVSGALAESPLVSLPPDGVPDVPGDGPRLEQMLAALVACCAQRDPGAPPQVDVACVDDHVRFTVSDRGPPVDLDTFLVTPLYEPADGGLGLGLVLAQAIARAHQGELRFAAREGGGISFECTLPQADCSAP